MATQPNGDPVGKRSVRLLRSRGDARVQRMGRATRAGADAGTVAVDRRLAALERLLSLRDDIDLARHTKVLSWVQQVGIDAVRDVEALLTLYGWYPTNLARDPLGGYAMSPRNLLQMIGLAREARPRVVVELGSGASTVWLGRALQEWNGYLLSVDHDKDFAAATQARIVEHGLTSRVDVVHAPLRELLTPLGKQHWYAPESFTRLDQIDMVVVDGPPGITGKLARNPAVYELHSRLAPGALILVDDALRVDEKQMVSDWLREFPQLRLVQGGAPGLVSLRWSSPPLSGHEKLDSAS